MLVRHPADAVSHPLIEHRELLCLALNYPQHRAQQSLHVLAVVLLFKCCSWPQYANYLEEASTSTGTIGISIREDIRDVVWGTHLSGTAIIPRASGCGSKLASEAAPGKQVLMKGHQ